VVIQVLVSAQNLQEVDLILTEAPDILDLKNPKEGSLGAPVIPTVVSIKKRITHYNETSSSNVQFSVAIGDFPFLPGTASMATYGVEHLEPDYIKIGLLGPTTIEEGVLLTRSVVDAVQLLSSQTKVVVVGYADQKDLNMSIDPLLIPEITSLGGADVAMLDTKIKNGRSLFDNLTLKEVQNFMNEAKKWNVSIALAGSLNFNNIPHLKKLHPNIVGVRSMVCRNFDRLQGKIEPKLIAKLKSSI
jgi:uncharacterized protein (UPF0264 family)